MFETSDSSIYDETALPAETNIHCWLNGVIIGTFRSHQGDVWISTLKSDQSVGMHKQMRLHSKNISCIDLSGSLLFTAGDDGSLCISELQMNNIVKNDINVNDATFITSTFDQFLVPENEINEKDMLIKKLHKEVCLLCSITLNHETRNCLSMFCVVII